MEIKPLPDYCLSQRELLEVAGVVLHYFSGKNVDPSHQFDLDVCFNLFKDLNRPKAEREFYMFADNWPDGRMHASAHVLIGRDGETWQLAPFDRQCYHAGASVMNGRPNCNAWTLGRRAGRHRR